MKQLSTSITKWVYREFGAPLIKILFFGPLYSPWKIIKNNLLGGSNRRLLKLLQSLRPTGLVGRVILKNMAKFCFIIQTMRLMVEFHARQLFFAVFFLKEIKRHARAKNDVGFFLFVLPVPQLLLRTDAKSYRPIL